MRSPACVMCIFPANRGRSSVSSPHSAAFNPNCRGRCVPSLLILLLLLRLTLTVNLFILIPKFLTSAEGDRASIVPGPPWLCFGRQEFSHACGGPRCTLHVNTLLAYGLAPKYIASSRGILPFELLIMKPFSLFSSLCQLLPFF